MDFLTRAGARLMRVEGIRAKTVKKWRATAGYYAWRTRPESIRSADIVHLLRLVLDQVACEPFFFVHPSPS
jgi:hypothetical protein